MNINSYACAFHRRRITSVILKYIHDVNDAEEGNNPNKIPSESESLVINLNVVIWGTDGVSIVDNQANILGGDECDKESKGEIAQAKSRAHSAVLSPRW